MRIDPKYAHLVEYRNGAFYLLPSALLSAWKQNRVGELDDPGNEVNSEGTKEEDLKFAVFTAGTIGMRVVDAYRITAEGRIYEGYCPVPVALKDVSNADDEEVREALDTIVAKRGRFDQGITVEIPMDEKTFDEWMEPGENGIFTVEDTTADGMTITLFANAR